MGRFDDKSMVYASNALIELSFSARLNEVFIRRNSAKMKSCSNHSLAMNYRRIMIINAMKFIRKGQLNGALNEHFLSSNGTTVSLSRLY